MLVKGIVWKLVKDKHRSIQKILELVDFRYHYILFASHPVNFILFHFCCLISLTPISFYALFGYRLTFLLCRLMMHIFPF